MKLTKYVFLVPTKRTGKYALYNSFNNIFAIIDDELKDVLESGDFSRLPQQFVDSLKSSEFIREDHEDELKMLQYKKKDMRFSAWKTEFYIMPTTACNLSCPSCRLGDKTMSDKTVENTLEAVKREAKERGSTHLWTFILGGEPLLEADIALRLSQELAEWAKKEQVLFNNCLITNGTLLTEDILDKFAPYVTSMQVTLEGPRSYHDTVRVYKDGTPTFDHVIDGLMLLKEHNIHTIINVPITKENCTSVPELIEYLKEKGIHEGGIMHVRLFLSENQINNVCLSYSPLCNEGREDAVLMMDVWEEAWKRGFRATAKPTQTPYCSCIKDGAYTIDPEGNVYKCIAMVGNPDERAAVLEDGTISSKNHTFYDLLSRDATQIPECSQCKYLPLCAGGCPLRAKSLQNSYHAPDCGLRKSLFDKRIELFLRFKHPEHFGADEGTRTPNV